MRAVIMISTTRIRWIIFRGVAIALVVLGHLEIP